jgi:hypothetical protein
MRPKCKPWSGAGRRSARATLHTGVASLKAKAAENGNPPAGQRPAGLRLYNLGMAAKPSAKPKGPWTAEEAARNERVAKARVEHDRARGVSVNMEEAVRLTRFGNRFAKAFRDTGRDAGRA